MKKTITIALLSLGMNAVAQFHTLKIPQSSSPVEETQTIGVTQIKVKYHSPATRGRDVWNNPNVIPQKGAPIPWRAGANMNTTIQFSTPVKINGQLLDAGIYGFHIIPDGHNHQILFAHKANQWGSYYLDVEKDVRLKVTMKDTLAPFSEQLNYHFYDRSENQLTIALQWGDRQIPFQVSVDLNATVVESFRAELLGINTYHWQAWNDAAKWCYDHQTNLEEALEWANRSIEGGSGGFAADKNLNNLGTKILLLNTLEKKAESQAIIEEAKDMNYAWQEGHQLVAALLRIKMDEGAYSFMKQMVKNHQEHWVIQLDLGVAEYYSGNPTKALTTLKRLKKQAPKGFLVRLDAIIEEMKNKTYQYPGRSE